MVEAGRRIVDFVADLVGFYDDRDTTAVYLPSAPTRILDARNGAGTNGIVAQLAAHATMKLAIAGVDGVPATGVGAVELNLTVTGSAASGYLIVYPDGGTSPTTSRVNVVGGRTVANMTVMPIDVDGSIDICNGGSKPIDVLADLTGFYDRYPYR